MLTIRVKRINDNEVDITILPAKPAGEPTLNEEPTTEKIITTHERLTQERGAAIELKNFLKDGARYSLDCWAFLKSAGFKTDEMNPTRVRRYAEVEITRKEGKSWWFLSAPLREAAVELKNFLKDGERSASDCQQHLAGLNLDEMNLWLVRKYAGVAVVQKDGQTLWFVSDQLVEITESFQFEDDDPRLELIEEDGCGSIGWDGVK